MEERLPSVMKLEEESRALREFHVLDVEVPGQYLNDQVRILGFGFPDFQVSGIGVFQMVRIKEKAALSFF